MNLTPTSIPFVENISKLLHDWQSDLNNVNSKSVPPKYRKFSNLTSILYCQMPSNIQLNWMKNCTEQNKTSIVGIMCKYKEASAFLWWAFHKSKCYSDGNLLFLFFLLFSVFSCFFVVVFFSLGFILSLMAMSREFSRSLLAHEMLLVHREIATTVCFSKGEQTIKSFWGFFQETKGNNDSISWLFLDCNPFPSF